MKPLYKVFHSKQFQLLLPRKLPTSCQSRFIQANLLPTFLLCPLQNSDTLPLCPAPRRQLCPLSAFSVPFWASNALLWEVLRFETHQFPGHLSWPSPSLLTWIQSVLDMGNPKCMLLPIMSHQVKLYIKYYELTISFLQTKQLFPKV